MGATGRSSSVLATRRLLVAFWGREQCAKRKLLQMGGHLLGDRSPGHLFLKVEELGLIFLGGPQVLSGVWSYGVVMYYGWS